MSVTSAMPALKCQAAFTTGPFVDPGVAGPNWTDLSAYIRAATTTRGRQRDLDRVEAGTATVTLDNRDRRFEGQYAASPYYPNLQPNNWIRLIAGYLGEVLVDNPTAYYRLGDAAGSTVMADLLRLNPGTYSATGVTLGAKGVIPGRSGLVLDGAAGYGLTPSATAVSIATPAWTLEAWVKPTSLATYQTVFSQANGAGGATLNITTTGQLQFYGSSAVITSAVNLIPVNQWSHLVATYGAGTITLYVNGVQVASAAENQPTNTAYATYLGCLSGASQFLVGGLSEVAFYAGSTLSPTRIAAHHAEASKQLSDGFLFTGYTDGWPVVNPDPKVDSVVVVPCTDMFKLFARTPLTQTSWQVNIQQLNAAGQVQAWVPLADGNYLSPAPIDIGPNNYVNGCIGQPIFGQTGCLAPYGDETGVTFNAAGKGITLDSRLQLGRGGAPFSIEILMQRTGATAINPNGEEIWTQSGGRYLLYLEMGISGGVQLNYIDLQVGGFAIGSYTTDLADGNVHVFAVTSDGTNLSLYVDGVLTGTEAAAGGVGVDPSTHQTIGNSWNRYYVNGSYQFQGTLNEFVAFPSCLTAAQAALHASWVLDPGNGQSSGARIQQLLTYVNLPASLQNIATGISTLAPSTLDTDLLTALNTVGSTEESLLAMDTNGQVLFYDRDQPYKAPGNVSQQTIGDGGSGFPTELPYTDYVPAFDEIYLVNQVVVAPPNGGSFTINNPAAQAQYGVISADATDLLYNNALEMVDHANWLLHRAATAFTEVRAVTISPRMQANDAWLTDTMWGLCLVRQLNDLVTVKRRPPGGGTAQTFPVRIAGISHSITPLTWSTTFQLSGFTDQYWVVGDATYGVLGSTAIPGF